MDGPYCNYLMVLAFSENGSNVTVIRFTGFKLRNLICLPTAATRPADRFHVPDGKRAIAGDWFFLCHSSRTTCPHSTQLILMSEQLHTFYFDNCRSILLEVRV